MSNSNKNNTNNDLEVWKKDKIIIQQEKNIERLSFNKMFSYIANAFNLERGIFQLMWKLSTRPGPTIKSYLDTGRYNILSPIKYFLIIIGLTIFITSVTNFNIAEEAIISLISENEDFDVLDKDEWEKIINKEFVSSHKIDHDSVDTDSIEFTLFSLVLRTTLEFKHKNLLSIFYILFFSFLSWILLRKSKYNFIEHLAINTYIITHIAIIHLIATLCQSTNMVFSIVELVSKLTMILFVYKYLFQKNWFWTIILTIVIYALNEIALFQIFHYFSIYYFNYLG